MPNRIKLTGPVEVEVADTAVVEKKRNRNKKRKLPRRLQLANKASKSDSKEKEEGGVDKKENEEGCVDKKEVGDGGVDKKEVGEDSSDSRNLLMIRTENLNHDPFEQTQELKV